MAYIITILAAITLIWWLLMVGLKKMSDHGYPPEMDFPETEWPEMAKNNEPLPAKKLNWQPPRPRPKE